MRFALLGFLLSLGTLSVSAQVNRLAQSGVTLSATFSKTGGTLTNPPAANNRFISETTVTQITFGNRDLLEIILGAQTPAITDIRGWSLIAVWANWSGDESSYRFFASRRTSSGLQVIQVTQIELELLQPYVAKNLRLRSGQIVSGTEVFKAYARLGLTDPRTASASTRRVPSTTVFGMLGGTGGYSRPARSTEVIYLPGSTSFTGFGKSTDNAGADSAANPDAPVFVSAGLRIGRSQAIDASLFPAVAGPGRGPDGGDSAPNTTNAGSSSASGSVTIAGSGSFDLSGTAPGGTLVEGTLQFGNPSPGQTAGTLVLNPFSNP